MTHYEEEFKKKVVRLHLEEERTLKSFSADFLQIRPHERHPCLKLTVGTINPRIGLSPPSKRPCWAHY
jgi:hypothetical protein